MPSPIPVIQASAECPYMVPGVQVVIAPIWKPNCPETTEKKETACEASSKPQRLDQSHGLDAISKVLGECVYELAQQEGFCAGRGKTLVLRMPSHETATVKRVILLGMGKAKNLDHAGLVKAYKAAFKTALAWDVSLHDVAVSLVSDYTLNGGSLFNDESAARQVSVEEVTMAVTEALYTATYASMEAKKAGKTFTRTLFTHENTATVDATLKIAHALDQGRALTKDLVNKPSNTKTTDTIVDAARTLQTAYPNLLTLNVVDDVDTLRKEMPCFFAVAQGSVKSDPPKFIHLKYTPANATRKIALVGKSVIFDTGGYQVKPGNYMVTMKGDMAGSACVLGTLKALCELGQDGVEVHGFIATTPNKIDADAMIPDSILDTTCGKKVEMRHTDAEGRLTLIDAVTKACDVEPEAIVTIATLTGAAKMAVGETICLMSNMPAWGKRVEAAAQRCGDPVQYVDITPADFENIKSKLDGADIRNTNRGSSRGFQTAGAFVMCGAPDTMPMVHLDIAGADMHEDETSTGTSVGTLFTFIRDLNN
jgi:leucyl aminopeptidase